ncbi:MAG: TlpA disulfide reductase family protein [Planctomycetota bacterium]
MRSSACLSRSLRAVLATAFLCCPGASPATGEEENPLETIRTYRETRRDAMANLDRREYAALLKLLKSETLGGDRPWVLLRACELALAQEKWSAVIEHAEELEKAELRKPLLWQARSMRALALAHSRRKAEEALGLYLQVAESDPDRSARPLLEAADVMVALDAGMQARRALDALMKLRPELALYVAERQARLDLLGAPAPPLEAKDVDGRPFNAGKLQGTTVVLVFWAAWEDEGLELLERLEKRAGKSRGKLAVQGICIDPMDGVDYLKFLCRSHGVAAAPIVAEQGFAGELAQSYGVDAVPATRLIDAQGKLRGIDLRADALFLALDELVK